MFGAQFLPHVFGWCCTLGCLFCPLGCQYFNRMQYSKTLIVVEIDVIHKRTTFLRRKVVYFMIIRVRDFISWKESEKKSIGFLIHDEWLSHDGRWRSPKILFVSSHFTFYFLSLSANHKLTDLFSDTHTHTQLNMIRTTFLEKLGQQICTYTPPSAPYLYA